MSSGRVLFKPQEKEVEVPAGTSILQAAALAGIPVEGNCGGKGSCGKCKVKILNGNTLRKASAENNLLSSDELAQGWVLACRHNVKEDVVVETWGQNENSLSKTDIRWRSSKLNVDPSIAKFYLCMESPTLEDRTPDLERLINCIPQRDNIVVGRRILATLPQVLRESGFQVTAVLAGDTIVTVEPGNTTGRMYGIALDIGTTTLAGYLLDLDSGEVLAVSVSSNPQSVYGADIISRIYHAANNYDGLIQLQDLVLGAVNSIISCLLQETDVNKEEIYELVVVGNTTMSHLFLGIDPANLAPAPFIPAFNRAVELPSSELGLDLLPESRVLVLPNIAGFVGSDTVGMMLAARIDQREGTCLAVDIGTNGEVVLASRGRVLICSSAAGPAFEGSHIRHGMRAVDGAIESVVISNDVRLGTIGGLPPRGICGSGLIDAVAEMLKAGIIDETGRFTDPEKDRCKLNLLLQNRLVKKDDCTEFILAPRDISGTGYDIVITQRDIKELQLAKAAIHAGIQVLLREMGLDAENITEILLAGAFGNHVRKDSALAIGLLPPVSLHRILPIGNAAGEGAVLSLLSRTERKRALALCQKAEHVDLSARADFYERFIDALRFPFPPS
ncbi:ASKHA domain-containing protein [Pelotomaculum propionicicum]|uniref:ASKHA domain-containing protein n=1 Tax=Pelotomaculum propionicicum TaxID=258475 RepID=UPI003B7BACE6